MSQTNISLLDRRFPAPSAILELLKPVTWFAAMWAFFCGVISSGAPALDRLPFIFGGVLLAGPFACAASQAVNDWFDRDVDAINQPARPIPSGRLPGRWGFYIAIFWSLATLCLGAALGPWAFGASAVATALAWAYSAPPFRLKSNGWLGAAAVGFSYEGIAWFTGAAVMVGTLPRVEIIWLAILYSIGAHGIMTLNDFKAVKGDKALGLRSLPVQLGPARAAQVACGFMIVPQLIVALWLGLAGAPIHAGGLIVLVIAQCALMPTLLKDPCAKAPWYNATGTSLYVSGMMVAAFAVRILDADPVVSSVELILGS
ncbi:MAG: chlorophyll synthase ChlG [Pseudomonadota bacterium]